MTDDQRHILATARLAAFRAGSYQMRRRDEGFDVMHKGEIDLVTDVDRESERIIIETIRDRFPDHDILAEESGWEARRSSFRWVIDPIDGTTNFAHGFPWFCISIACERDGELECGVIHSPCLSFTFYGVRGEGAWLNDAPLRVSRRSPLINSLLATGFPYDRTRDNENNFDHFFRFQLATRGVRRAGSAALDLAAVAAGWFDGFWECKLKPWDVAAGVLLVREAGGTVTSYTGEPYRIDDHRIVATNGLIHDEMLRLIAEGDVTASAVPGSPP